MNKVKQLLEKYNVNITLKEIIDIMSSVEDSQCDFNYDKVIISIQYNKIIIYDVELEKDILVLEVK